MKTAACLLSASLFATLTLLVAAPAVAAPPTVTVSGETVSGRRFRGDGFGEMVLFTEDFSSFAATFERTQSGSGLAVAYAGSVEGRSMPHVKIFDLHVLGLCCHPLCNWRRFVRFSWLPVMHR